MLPSWKKVGQCTKVGLNTVLLLASQKNNIEGKVELVKLGRRMDGGGVGVKRKWE